MRGIARRWRGDEIAATGCASGAMTACCDRLRRWRGDEIAATGCAGLAMTANPGTED
ncbi:hypothetical protein [Roseiflexus sp.]|uniref:hypothetical protein n=1 Tax=Roseiflexus sp. TaxID=2562120 RepID=UPI0025902957|nr:hypothetical protein [Roseiflexus sp.]